MCVEFHITSNPTQDYNCFAWAAGESDSWWGHNGFADEFWPEGVTEEMTIEAFTEAYQTIGYQVCQNELLENGFEKIAIYQDQAGKPKHAARQKEDGVWTSKIGLWEDVQHRYANHLVISIRGEQVDYGRVAAIMKREIQQ